PPRSTSLPSTTLFRSNFRKAEISHREMLAACLLLPRVRTACSGGGGVSPQVPALLRVYETAPDVRPRRGPRADPWSSCLSRYAEDRKSTRLNSSHVSI